MQISTLICDAGSLNFRNCYVQWYFSGYKLHNNPLKYKAYRDEEKKIINLSLGWNLVRQSVWKLHANMVRIGLRPIECIVSLKYIANIYIQVYSHGKTNSKQICTRTKILDTPWQSPAQLKHRNSREIPHWVIGLMPLWQGWEFALLLFRSLLFRSKLLFWKNNIECFALVALYKRATMS